VNRSIKQASAALVIAIASGILSGQSSTSAPAEPSTRPAEKAQTVGDLYPGLASAALVHARPASLPDGVVLRARDVTVKETDLSDEIAKAPETVREQLRKNASFLLEQMASRQLLLAEAKVVLAKDGKDMERLSQRELLDSLFAKLTANVKVTDRELADFHAKNKDTVGGAPLEQVKAAIERYLRQRKQQEIVNRHIAALGQRTTIEVSGTWVKVQAQTTMDNPVDKARVSGRPLLVDFGAKGCIPCDKLAPILDAMKSKYEGKANVIFVSVREEQILAVRYGIQSIPVQIFFDAGGKEVFRHTGFWAREELEKKLAEMGVK